MLHQSQALAPLGAIAVQLRERLDGSGYPRGLSGAAVSQPARVLGAADAYQAMREPAPTGRRCRPTWPLPSCAPRSGPAGWTPRRSRPCSAAAGHRVPRPPQRAGRADAARGRGAAAAGPRPLQQADRAPLVISPKTVGNHVEHIYAKIGSLEPRRRGALRDAARAAAGGAAGPRNRRRQDEANASCRPHRRFLDWIPVQPKESEMLKVSRQSAEHVEHHGPVEDRHQDRRRLHHQLHHVRVGRRRDAAPEGAAQRSLRLPALGLRDQGPDDLHHRRRRGGRVEAGDAFYLPPGHAPGPRPAPSSCSSAPPSS